MVRFLGGSSSVLCEGSDIECAPSLCCRVPKGGVFKGGGNWGTLRIPREDWGTLGNIRED